MTILVIGGLLVLSAWLGMRLVAMRTENTGLRAQVQSLKRQLLRLR